MKRRIGIICNANPCIIHLGISTLSMHIQRYVYIKHIIRYGKYVQTIKID